jgi:hypothetical protein
MLDSGSLVRAYSGISAPLVHRTNTEGMCREY